MLDANAKTGGSLSPSGRGDGAYSLDFTRMVLLPRGPGSRGRDAGIAASFWMVLTGASGLGEGSGDGQVGELNEKPAWGAKGEGFGASRLARSGGLAALGLPDQLDPLLRMTRVRTLLALASGGVVG